EGVRTWAGRGILDYEYRTDGVSTGFTQRAQRTLRSQPLTFFLCVLGVETTADVELDAGQPDELTAPRARVRHPQIAFERDESAAAHTRTGWTNRGRFRVDRGHAQQATGCGTGNREWMRLLEDNAGAGRVAGIPAEQA